MIFIAQLKKIIKIVLPKSFLQYLRRKVSLVRIPDNKKSTVSDLFPFRINDGWETHFELLNVPFLIEPVEQKSVTYCVKFIFFNESGKIIHEWITQQKSCYRRTICLNDILHDKSATGYGTFACFHENYLPHLISQGSFLAERGYTGYLNKSISNVKGYVHGNLDALAKTHNDRLICLGKSHRKKKEFRFQYQLDGPAIYEFGFVNTSNKAEILIIEILANNKSVKDVQKNIQSRGIIWIPIRVKSDEILRIVIHSKLILPRPVVFRIIENSFDVFHG
jgi:hypothetical protein